MRYLYLAVLAILFSLCGCVPVQQERITTIHADGGGTSTIITILPDMPMVRSGYSDFASRLPDWATHNIYNRDSDLCLEIGFPFNSVSELNSRMKTLKGFTSHIEQFEFEAKPKELGFEYILSVDLTRNTGTERASDAQIYTKYTVQMPGETIGFHTINFKQDAVNGKRYFFSDYYAPVMTWVDLTIESPENIEVKVAVGLDQMEMNSAPALSGQWEKYKATLDSRIQFGKPISQIIEEEGIKFDTVSFSETFTNPLQIFKVIDLPSCNNKCLISPKTRGFIKKTYDYDIVVTSLENRNFPSACYRVVLPGKILQHNGTRKSENTIEWLIGTKEGEKYLQFSYEAIDTKQLVLVIILPFGLLLFILLLVYFARKMVRNAPQQTEKPSINNNIPHREDYQ